MRRVTMLTVAILTAAGIAAVPSTAASADPPVGNRVETVTLFDPGASETPENIAIDEHRDAYVSLALTGEIRKITPDGTTSTVARLPMGGPPLTFCGPFFAGLTGIAFGENGDLYANLASCDLDSRGIWWIPAAGQPQRIAALPLAALPNGLVYDDGVLYVADSALGVVWRVPAAGGTPQVWASGPQLAPSAPGLPGPNGLKLFGGELYVSNPSQGTVVAITVASDGSAGASRIHASGVFCDDFAFDVSGDLYCGTDPFNTLLRIAPDGSVVTVLTAADGLDGPTAVAFGRENERFEVYVTNGAFPFLSGPEPRRPSLMRLPVDVPGFPHL